MKFSIKKLFGRNNTKIKEEKVETIQEKMFARNREKFLDCNIDANKAFIGIPEYDEIINQIEEFKLGKIYGTRPCVKTNFFGRESSLTLTDGRKIEVASGFNKERNYYASSESQHLYVSMDFALNGYANGINFNVMGAESKFIDKKDNKKIKSTQNYITYVIWPRYSFNTTYNFYVGTKWLGKCFHKESIKSGRFQYHEYEFMVVNQLPVGEDNYIDNGRLYFLKFNTCADYGNQPNPLYKVGYQVKYNNPNLEMYSMEDNGQFNNKSTLEQVEKTFEMLKNEKLEKINNNQVKEKQQ
ncbi:MAG: hypothetical protein PHQ62_01470 [Clostridia bacterium]|nr:hypothetical protein [Clostridia bacterium]